MCYKYIFAFLLNINNSPKNFCGVDLLRLVMLIASLSTNWIFSLDGWSTGLVIVSILTDSANKKPVLNNNVLTNYLYKYVIIT